MLEIGQEWRLYTTPFRLKETTTPSNAEVPANTLSLYVKDKAGVSALFAKDDAFVEHELTNGITGTGANGRVTFWTGTRAISSSTSFLWDNTNFALTVKSNASVLRGFVNEHYQTGGQGPLFQGRRANGSITVPTATQVDDVLLDLNGQGHDGSDFTGGRALIRFQANQTFTGSAQGSRISFFTTPNGSTTIAECARFGNDGELLIGSTVHLVSVLAGRGIGVFRTNNAEIGSYSCSAAVALNSGYRAAAFGGTVSAPGQTVSGQGGFYAFSARDSSGNMYSPSLVGLFAAENQTASARGSYITFDTTATGATTRTERFRVGPSGQWGIGGATFGTAGRPFLSGGASAAPTWGGNIIQGAFYTEQTAISDPGAAAASSKRMWVEDFHGFMFLTANGPDGASLRLARDNVVVVRNVTGSTINKGQTVYVTGANGNVPTIGLARANSASTMPALGLAFENIANNSFGRVMIWGVLDFDTSAFLAGDILFVSSSVAGGLTATEPAGANLSQRIAIVTASGVGNGRVVVTQTTARAQLAHSSLSGLTSGDDHTQYALLAGRSGGQTLIGGTAAGNSLTLQSTSHATKGNIILGSASVYDEVNDRIGIGTLTPNVQLDISGAIAYRKLDVALGNGANNDVSISTATFIRVTGPTAGYSISGFANGFDGRRLLLYNSVAQQLTITNEGAGSTAANRITTLTGADVVLRAGTSFALFVYDSSAARWILTSTN